MLKLNTEYTLKDMCEILEWKYCSGGNARKKIINEIESSYEYIHPVNKRTGKPKKSYILTKELKKPVLEDNRKPSFSNEEFEYLLNYILFTGWNRNDYRQRNKVKDALIKNNEVYLTNRAIFEGFGLNIYEILNNIGTEINDTKSYEWKMFKSICIDATKSNSITRICNKYNLPKNSLYKGILRKQSEFDNTLILDNDLLAKYDTRFDSAMHKHGCKNKSEIFDKEKYFDIYNDVVKEFESKDKIYGVKKCNIIKYSYDEYNSFKNKVNVDLKNEYQSHFRTVVFNSIEKSATNRITGAKKYKKELNEEQKNRIASYLERLREIVERYN